MENKHIVTETVIEHICQKEEEIDAITADVQTIKNDINSIKNDRTHTTELLVSIQTQISKLEKRLYVDNGTFSLQTLLKMGENRMTNIEASIKSNLELTNTKLTEIEKLPANYARFTIGIITLLGVLCGLIIFLVKHA